MAAYSMDFRRRVMALYDEGYATSEVAEIMGCCPAWARGLKQRLRETGSIAPRVSRRKYERIYQDEDEEKIRQLIARKPDATLREVADELAKPICLGGVSRTLKRLGLSRKKSPRTPASSSVRTSLWHAGSGSITSPTSA